MHSANPNHDCASCRDLEARLERQSTRLAEVLRRFADECAETRNEIQSRVDAAGHVSEEAVLSVGASISTIVEDARNQLRATQALEEEVGHDSAIGVAIGHSAEVVDRFVGTVAEHLAEHRQTTSNSLELSQKVAKTGRRIESITLTAHVLSINARIEAARLGEAGIAFAVIAGQMGELSARINEANSVIQMLADDLQCELPTLARGVEGLVELTERFGQDLTDGLQLVESAEVNLRGTVGDSAGQGQMRVDHILTTSQEALSALQFQDPMQQALQQIPALTNQVLRGLAERLAVIEAGADVVSLFDAASTTVPLPVDNPLREEVTEGAVDGLDAGEVMLF